MNLVVYGLLVVGFFQLGAAWSQRKKESEPTPMSSKPLTPAEVEEARKEAAEVFAWLKEHPHDNSQDRRLAVQGYRLADRLADRLAQALLQAQERERELREQASLIAEAVVNSEWQAARELSDDYCTKQDAALHTTPSEQS